MSKPKFVVLCPYCLCKVRAVRIRQTAWMGISWRTCFHKVDATGGQVECRHSGKRVSAESVRPVLHSQGKGFTVTDNPVSETQSADEDVGRVLMRAILTKTANVLKGPPGDLKIHGWSDLDTIAQQLKEQVSILRDALMTTYDLVAESISPNKQYDYVQRAKSTVIKVKDLLGLTPKPKEGS